MFEKELLAPIAAKNRIKSEMQSLKKMPARIQLTPEQSWHGPGVHRNRDLGQLVNSETIDALGYPGLDRSVSGEALRTFNVYGGRYRNQRIGDYLKELHLTEGRNAGFGKILRALERNGSPLPEFITDVLKNSPKQQKWKPEARGCRN